MTARTSRHPSEGDLPRIQRLRVLVLRLTALVALPLVLFTQSAWLHPRWVFEVLEVLGILLVIAAVLGRFWAILYIGGRKSAQVVQDGPYSVCRHPLYLFSTLGVLGLGLMLGSLMLCVALGGLTFAILSATAAREEAHLTATFGPAYTEYASRVPRIWPRPSLFHTAGQVTFEADRLRSNLADALVFLAFIPFAEFMQEIKELALFPVIPVW